MQRQPNGLVVHVMSSIIKHLYLKKTDRPVSDQKERERERETFDSSAGYRSCGSPPALRGPDNGGIRRTAAGLQEAHSRC